MKKLMKIAVAALMLVAVTPKIAQAQTKVAHINLDSLLQIMPDYAKARDSAVKIYDALADQMAKMQLDLNKDMSDYDSLSKIPGGMTPLIKRVREAQIMQKQNNIETFSEAAQQDFEMQRLKIFEPVYNKILVAVKKVALAKGYKYVIDSSKSKGTILYAAPEDDIFDAVRVELKVPIPPK
ncbi:MAG TPA: OmpH family outer membrane protein [Bacteroidia bacterium]|nr:OmpH family outer membrane protein [Bacteroidia bacterium]